MSSPSHPTDWSTCMSWPGLASLGGAGLLWLLSRSEGDRAQTIKGITSHEKLDGRV